MRIVTRPEITLTTSLGLRSTIYGCKRKQLTLDMQSCDLKVGNTPMQFNAGISGMPIPYIGARGV